MPTRGGLGEISVDAEKDNHAAMTCPHCGSERFEPLFDSPGFDQPRGDFKVVVCAECGLTACAPAMSDGDLAPYYDAVYYGGGERKFSGVIEWLLGLGAAKRAGWLFKLAGGRRGAKIVDIGCGRGVLLRELVALGCDCHGVERGDFPVDAAESGIVFHRGGIESVDLTPESFDMAVIWHVLEHLNDPAEAVARVAAALRPDGRFVVAVPNFASWQAELFRGEWFHLDPPRHRFHFTPETLKAVLESSGFEIESVRTASMEQDIYGFAQSLLNIMAPSEYANALYSLLKRRRGVGDWVRLTLWAVPAALILPFAVAEYFAAAAAGRGASLIVVAKKTG